MGLRIFNTHFTCQMSKKWESIRYLKRHNIFIQALPYLCLPQHLPAHHLGPGFLHLYTPGGEYLPRKLDPVRQIQDFLTHPCVILVLSDKAALCPTWFSTYFPLQSRGRRLESLPKTETESKWKLQMKNKTVPMEHYTKKSLKHTLLFPYWSLSNLNSEFKIIFEKNLFVLQYFIAGIFWLLSAQTFK